MTTVGVDGIGRLVTNTVAGEVPDAHVVIAPRLGHNVLGDDCVRSLRNDWLAGALDGPPVLPSCLDEPLELP